MSSFWIYNHVFWTWDLPPPAVSFETWKSESSVFWGPGDLPPKDNGSPFHLLSFPYFSPCSFIPVRFTNDSAASSSLKPWKASTSEQSYHWLDHCHSSEHHRRQRVFPYSNATSGYPFCLSSSIRIRWTTSYSLWSTPLPKYVGPQRAITVNVYGPESTHPNVTAY